MNIAQIIPVIIIILLFSILGAFICDPHEFIKSDSGDQGAMVRAFILSSIGIEGGWESKTTPVYNPTPVYVPTPTPIPTLPELTNSQKLDIIIGDLYNQYAPKKAYKINTKFGSEVYVCSHFGCDMAENLINSGYNAGVVINWNQLHALTWVELNNQTYIIEPQNGNYWTLETYDRGRNIDVVSLSKGREHAKHSSEVLHR